MENEIVVYDSKPLTANDIKAQVDLIQDVMKKVMRDKEHYGVIPGCGDKPALLKPGAEKLNMTFRMAPDPETEILDLGGGHREYRVKCVLRGIESGRVLGAGVGSASTMETKWRYRNAEPELTDKPIPKAYWDAKKTDPGKALDLIGGKGFAPRKTDSGWFIAKLTGEKVEHGNPADFYNTCWKMAKKRALVDAVLTVTAASDIFTQDVEEMVENGAIDTSKHEPLKDKTEGKGDEKENQFFAVFLKKIIQAKEFLGDDSYYKILGSHGVEHANEIKTIKEMKVVYDEMVKAFKEKQKEANDADNQV